MFHQTHSRKNNLRATGAQVSQSERKYIIFKVCTCLHKYIVSSYDLPIVIQILRIKIQYVLSPWLLNTYMYVVHTCIYCHLFLKVEWQLNFHLTARSFFLTCGHHTSHLMQNKCIKYNTKTVTRGNSRSMSKG